MVVDISNNSIKITKTASTGQEQYGELIWPKFYGIKRWRKWLHLSGKLIVFFFGAWFFLFMIYSLLTISSIGDRIASMIGMILGLILMAVTVIFYRKERQSPNIIPMFFRGDLDWDLYENGIFGRRCLTDFSDKIETKFFYFKDISKVFLNIDDNKSNYILDLMKNADKKDAENEGSVWNESDYQLTIEENNLIKECVWFIDKEANLPLFFIVKEWIKDPFRFEAILRQKVKEVI